MTLADVGIRIEYFHGASDDHLRILGVDRSLLPDRQAWRAFYEEDYARPLHRRANFSLVWELDGQPVGFSSTDRIVFGQEAFMHLHIVDASLRQGGFGVEYVKMSTPVYFKKLKLQRLFSEPHALNAAPNRTLQRAGFKYLFSHETTPGPFNSPQVANRWLLENARRQDPSGV